MVIEGEEPAHFWHVLDGNEYASAHVSLIASVPESGPS